MDRKHNKPRVGDLLRGPNDKVAIVTAVSDPIRPSDAVRLDEITFPLPENETLGSGWVSNDGAKWTFVRNLGDVTETTAIEQGWVDLKQ